MKGEVDEALRALLEVEIGAEPNGRKSIVMVWVDTAFNGGLVLPRGEIERLEASAIGATQFALYLIAMLFLTPAP